jgi:oxygen-independent coproporphyrinogen-3 oxidase
VPSALPDGEPVPSDGSLPAGATAGLRERPFGLYLHVPFCASRCGYCDFNTYLGSELGGGGLQDSYAEAALAELRLAREVLGDRGPVVDTVFVGGGTPTLLPAQDLVRLLAGVRETFGLAPGAEVTTRPTPTRWTSATSPPCATAASPGVARHAVRRPVVLRVLDRTHTPGRRRPRPRRPSRPASTRSAWT